MKYYKKNSQRHATALCCPHTRWRQQYGVPPDVRDCSTRFNLVCSSVCDVAERERQPWHCNWHVTLSLSLSSSPHHSNKNMAMLCNIYPCASKSTICLDSNAILSSACSVSFFPFFLYTTLQTPFFELVSFACYRLLIADVRDTLMGSPHSKTCVWQDLHPYLQSWQLQRRKC